MTDDLELARRLTALILSHPGVTGVYPSGSLVRSIAAGLVGPTRGEDVDESRVMVDRATGGPTRVVATIGVEAGQPVPDVLRSVGDAVRAALDEQDPLAPPAVVELKASRIDTSGLGG